MPLVSVILPAYNASQTIKTAINSVLSQSFKDFELIIINDSSIDQTREEVLKFKDKRIVYIENDKNLGVSETLNKGLSLVSGEFIARMDADDICYFNRFEKQIKVLKTNYNTQCCGSWIQCFGKNITKTKVKFSNNNLNCLLQTILPHPTAMYRRRLISDLNLCYKSNVDDYYLWNKIYQSNNYHRETFKIIPEALLRYRIHDKQISKVNKNNISTDMILLRSEFFQEFIMKIGCHTKSDSVSVEGSEVMPILNEFKNKMNLLRGYNQMEKNEFIQNVCYSFLISMNRKTLQPQTLLKGISNIGLNLKTIKALLWYTNLRFYEPKFLID